MGKQNRSVYLLTLKEAIERDCEAVGMQHSKTSLVCPVVADG
jgi:hypothetical protein